MSDELPSVIMEIPREMTRTYFDGRTAFGAQHARPMITESGERTWDDDQLLEAAHLGRDLHPDVLAALCRRYLDFAQDEVTRTDELRVLRHQLATLQGVAAALQGELRTTRADLERISFENVQLRHEINGTTPVGVKIALVRDADRTIRMKRSAIENGGEV